MSTRLDGGARLGPYEILAPLGAGGMGEVYRARDTRLGREVAIKVLPPQRSSNAEVRARFDREAKTISSLNHPHICTLFDVGREGDTDYLVMELLEGETLANRLVKGPMPTARVLSIGAQIADALARAHRAGIVHRDLKPGNIMLTKSGAKLMDFGLARVSGPASARGAQGEAFTHLPTVAEPLTAEGSIVGTFQYMSPEQLEGQETDARSDIWALGCVLYEMTTGQRAFEGKSQASLIAAILEHEPAPIADVKPTSPPALDRLVRGCLAKDPDERVQTAHDVKLQLGWTSSDGSGTAAAVPPAPARSHRGRVLRPLASLVVLLAVGAVAFLAGRYGAAPADAPAGEFAQRTFRTEAIFAARFMPDGQTIVTSAALEGNRAELFVIRPNYAEPQPLGMKDVHLLAVSSQGELAVLSHARFIGHHRLFSGTLARMPLEGAAPRELMEDVREADWAPDGQSLAIIRDAGGSDRLEFPVGTVLRESSGYLSDIRFSPRGDLIAFMAHPSRFDDRGSVDVVDLSGKVREISSGYWGLEGMAWAPDGSALYYSGGKGGGNLFSVYRADLDGRVRAISDNAGALTIHDVAVDGTWAVTRDDIPTRILFRAAGSSTDVDLSWLDGSLGTVLSPDARTIIFTDQGRTAGPNYGVAMRPTSGGPIVRLGEGDVQDLSADGKSVLAFVPSTPPRIMSYPVGAGQAVRLDHSEFENLSQGHWLVGGQRLLVSGNIAGQPSRCFVFDPTNGEVTPVGAEGIGEARPSPDGKTFIARSKSGWSTYPLSGAAEGKRVASLTPQDWVIRWSPDGSAVFTVQQNQIPAPVERVDLATGKRQTVMMLSEGSSAGRVSLLSASMADDLQSIVYSAWDYTSVLFTATGKR